MSETFENEEPAGKPAFDLGTALSSIARRWYVIAAIIPLAAGAGHVLGHKLGKDSYEAETMVLYSQSADSRDATDPKTEILTLVDTVKLPENLARTIAILHLKTTPDILGKATDVEVGKNTTLMTIDAKWNSPEQTAAIANTLRDVFLAGVKTRLDTASSSMNSELEAQLTDVRSQQKIADAHLAGFITANQIVDIDKQAKSLLDEYNQMTVLLEQAQADRTTVQQQALDINDAVAQLKDTVAKERSVTASMESTGDVGIRIDRLREMINDDRAHRENVTELAYLKSELDRVKKLYDAGAVSEARYDEALTLYQKQDALTNDTPQIDAWKTQLTRLQKSITPAKDASTPSGALLETMVQKTFEIQLQKVAVVQRANYLLGQRNSVKLQLDRIPYLQRQYVVLSRDCDSLNQQRKDLEGKIALAQDMAEHEGASFTLVSAADVHEAPLKSTRKMITLGVSVGMILAGVASLVALELLDKRIKSPAEIRLHFDIPILCSIPFYPKGLAPFPGEPRSTIALQLSPVARRVRQSISSGCARIVVVGVSQGSGLTTVTANLAAAFGRQGEKVLLIDGQQHPNAGSRQFETLLDRENGGRGLAEYLKDPACELSLAVARTSMDGVDCMLPNGVEIMPDLFGSHRMNGLFDEAAKSYTTVLVEAPMLLSSVESEMLIHNADVIMLVARSESTLTKDIEKALEKIAVSGKSVAGIILNGVGPAFLKRE